MRRIAAAVGGSPKALYVCCPDKNAILHAIAMTDANGHPAVWLMVSGKAPLGVMGATAALLVKGVPFSFVATGGGSSRWPGPSCATASS